MNKLKSSLGVAAALVMTAALFQAPNAFAMVSVISAPASLVTNQMVLPPSSTSTPIFTFSLNANAGENLTSVVVEVDKGNGITTVAGNHISSLALYKDNGDGVFNQASDAWLGSQGTVVIGGPTSIVPTVGVPATGKFFVTLSTSSYWMSNAPADSVIVTFPANGINTTPNATPASTAVSTAVIAAGLGNLAPTLLTQKLSSGGVNINTPVFDAATLANTSGLAAGTVTYYVYSGGGCVAPAIFSDNEAVNSGAVAASTGFTTTATGTYSWQSVYSGDTNNQSAVSSCDPEVVGANVGGGVQNQPPPPVVNLGTGTTLPVTGLPIAAPIFLGLLAGGLAIGLAKKLSLI